LGFEAEAGDAPPSEQIKPARTLGRKVAAAAKARRQARRGERRSRGSSGKGRR
jgi:hypothetical protein